MKHPNKYIGQIGLSHKHRCTYIVTMNFQGKEQHPCNIIAQKHIKTDIWVMLDIKKYIYTHTIKGKTEGFELHPVVPEPKSWKYHDISNSSTYFCTFKLKDAQQRGVGSLFFISIDLHGTSYCSEAVILKFIVSKCEG